MTLEEAITGIDEIRKYFAKRNLFIEPTTTLQCCDMAIEALEKQIPVKPLRRSTTFNRSIKKLYCPVCKKYVGYENYRTRSVSKESGDYCDCGQKISWR